MHSSRMRTAHMLLYGGFPWTETLPGQRLPLTETLLDREPPGQRPPEQRPPWTQTLGQRPPEQRPPWTQTPCGQRPPL